mmetsp:Transcript_33268/g.80776  ORF Transcript_33268/g.80776 Transcript_33268/m.80776 type:complete len:183 (-) Transcript_33268:495-1043(-)
MFETRRLELAEHGSTRQGPGTQPQLLAMSPNKSLVKRRRPEELLPRECWSCSCGKRYKKTSVHSIGRHKMGCQAWQQDNPSTQISLSEELERCFRLAKMEENSSVNFSNVFLHVRDWENLRLGRFLADPTLNVMWVDRVTKDILSIQSDSDRLHWDKAFLHAVEPKIVFSQIMVSRAHICEI